MAAKARRRWAVGVIAALSFLGVPGSAAAAEGAKGVGPSGAVADLLPKGKGEAACFSATPAAPVPMMLEDWSDDVLSSQEVPGLKDPSGKPVTRPVPARSTGQVTGLVLSVAPDDLNPSEPYMFLLSVSLEGHDRKLRAAGPCNRFDPVETGLRQGPRGATTALGCAVECDGGSVAVEAAGAGRGLSVTFDDGGLRMTPGCSDEAEAFRLTAPAGQTTFVLAPAAPEACRALRAWDKER